MPSSASRAEPPFTQAVAALRSEADCRGVVARFGVVGRSQPQHSDAMGRLRRWSRKLRSSYGRLEPVI
jgi:hypothetical protein